MQRQTTVFSCLLVFLLCLCMSIASYARELVYDGVVHQYQEAPVTIVLNGQPLQPSVEPVILNGRTLLPLRDIVEKLGGAVTWIAASQQIKIDYQNTPILLSIGSRTVSVGQSTLQIAEGDPTPMLINNVTMIPVRYIGELMEHTVLWDANTRVVSLTRNATTNKAPAPSEPEPTEAPTESATQAAAEAAYISNITAKTDTDCDYIYLSMTRRVSPTITRLSSPERVVLDFPATAFLSNGGTVSCNGAVVSTVRYALHDAHARIVLDVSAQPQLSLTEWENGIAIRVRKSPNFMILYDGIARTVYMDQSYPLLSDEKGEMSYTYRLNNLKLAEETVLISDPYLQSIVTKPDGTIQLTATTADIHFLYTSSHSTVHFDSSVKETELVAEPATDVTDTTFATINKNCIVIDAGHGGKDPGAVSGGASEKDVTLSVALKVQAYLQGKGYEVIMTRTDDTYPTLADRSNISNATDAAVFVSIHCNSYTSASVNGTQVYYNIANNNGKILATEIYNRMVEATGFKAKGIQDGSSLYVIRTTKATAALVETAFISNDADRAKLLDATVQDKMAQAIAEGIIAAIPKLAL